MPPYYYPKYSEGNIERYTYAYGVEPLLKYIPKDAVVWCPCDTVESEFVKVISRQNKVIHSHLDGGKDFLTYEPDEHWDVLITNPPFAQKIKFIKRALSFGKPMAMLLPVTALNDKSSVMAFKDMGLQLLIFDKRMKFELGVGGTTNHIPFKCIYFCSMFLPHDIILEELQIT
jgi:hypothetical protein